jgi:hypothetical protein
VEGCVEGVFELVLITILRWWHDGLQRSSAGDGMALERQIWSMAPNIACPLKNAGKAGGGSAGAGVDTEFEGVVGGERVNEWSRRIFPQNPNIEHAGSISMGDVKRLAGRVESTYGMRLIPSLWGLGGWEPKNEWDRGIGPQNLNIQRAGLISGGDVKLLAGRVELVYDVK